MVGVGEGRPPQDPHPRGVPLTPSGTPLDAPFAPLTAA